MHTEVCSFLLTITREGYQVPMMYSIKQYYLKQVELYRMDQSLHACNKQIKVREHTLGHGVVLLAGGIAGAGEQLWLCHRLHLLLIHIRFFLQQQQQDQLLLHILYYTLA